MDAVTELYATVYADMLEYRYQMYEEVPWAHIHYQTCYDSVSNMSFEERTMAMGF